MFKKLASDALGLSDIGRIVAPADYDKVDADDYIFHEDKERIFFLIKSKMDEYCFTNRALLHVDGDSAVSSKRVMKRYEWYKHPVSGVTLETAGTIDRDVEIKFDVGGERYSIDVDKNQIGQLADLYKALYDISLVTSGNATRHTEMLSALDKGIHAVSDSRPAGAAKADDLRAVTEYAHQWMEEARRRYVKKDFSDVFEKYINA